MKYLLVLAVVWVALYLWRHNRATEARERAEAHARRQPTPAAATPQTMTTCRHCGLHLPADEAVKGQRGDYCGKEHKRLAEG